MATSLPVGMFLQMKSAASAAPTSLLVPMKVTPSLMPLVSTNDHADAGGLGLVDDRGERVRVGRRDGERVDLLGELVLDQVDLGLDVALLRRREHDEVDAELLAFSLAPASTAAQNGLPAPGSLHAQEHGLGAAPRQWSGAWPRR